jgi:4'-phosphopantetheinyl transferase EntD
VIERILPDRVVAVETRRDLLDIELFPEEQVSVANAVEKRRREFVTARACARLALQRLGLAVQPIPNGERGEPCWPAGVVGSITHCAGYRACAMAHASAVLALGIDAEPNEPLPEGVLAAIALSEEQAGLEELGRAVPGVHCDRLLFSAKESVYKAWFPLTRRWLGFEDASLRFEHSGGAGAPGELDDPHGTFAARLLVEGPRLDGQPLTGFSGRWLVRDGVVLTAIAVDALSPSGKT